MGNLDGSDYPYNLFEAMGVYDINSDKILGLEESLNTLSKLDSSILLMRYKDGLSLVEIEEKLNIGKEKIANSLRGSCSSLRFSKLVARGYSNHTKYIDNQRRDITDALKKRKPHPLESKLLGEEPICLPSDKLVAYFGGTFTVGDLVKHINGKGERWYSSINGIGLKKAEEIESILKEWYFRITINRLSASFCGKCSKSVSYKDNFCRFCGNSLK